MYVASSLQVAQRLNQLPQHVKYDTSLSVRREFPEVWTLHETLYGIPARLHFDFCDLLGVGEA